MGTSARDARDAGTTEGEGAVENNRDEFMAHAKSAEWIVELPNGSERFASKADLDNFMDWAVGEASESESNARQYAGHPTYDITGDAAFTAYENGVTKGMDRALKARGWTGP